MCHEFILIHVLILHAHFSGEEMKKRIDLLPSPSGTTYGGNALKETFQTLFHSRGKVDCHH